MLVGVRGLKIDLSLMFYSKMKHFYNTFTLHVKVFCCIAGNKVLAGKKEMLLMKGAVNEGFDYV